MKKKLIATVMLAALVSFAGCGASDENAKGTEEDAAGVEASNDGAEDEAPSADESAEPARDASLQITGGNVTCTVEYRSDVCTTAEFQDGRGYVSGDEGFASFKLTEGSASAEEYLANFEQQLVGGSWSAYRVEGFSAEELDSYEANGFTYQTFSYSYQETYTERNETFDTYGVIGYVQLTPDTALLMDDFGYDDFGGFIESSLYLKEVA